MARSNEQLERVKPEVTGLESYRRLIELQKQMIELSQLHEQTKRERDQLQEEVVREVVAQLRAHKNFWHRWPWAVRMQFKRWRIALLWNLARFGNRIKTTPSASN